MGASCEICQQNCHTQPKDSVNSKLTSISFGEEYFDTEMPKTDNFFVSYLSQSFNSQMPMKLKKNYKNNRYYYGNWFQGLPSGKGIIYQPNSILIDSFFHQGTATGQSKIIFIDKDKIYQGQLKQGKIEGNGKMIDNKTGYKFQGEYKNSYPRTGKLTLFKDNNIEHVDFLSYEQNLGNIIYRDGRIYEGQIQWNKLVPHGKGRVKFGTFDIKDYYEGQWKEGVYEGKGTFFWKNGQYYVGQYRNGKKHGKGRFKFLTGNQYEGQWANGLQNGNGVLYDKNGFKFRQGEWKNGSYQSGNARFHHSSSSEIIHHPYQTLKSLSIQKINVQYVTQNLDQILGYHLKKANTLTGNLTMQNLKK